MVRQLFVFCTLFALIGAERSAGQIIYTDFNPDTTASGMPLGTADSVFIDANQDGQNDFVINCSTWFYFVHQTCCWCYRNEIRGLLPSNGLAQDLVTPTFYNCGKIVLDSGWCVGGNYPYQNIAMLSGSGPCNSCGPPSAIPKYFPFQMDINGNMHYGWFRILATDSSITLYDMALNSVPNQCIITGQMSTGFSENETPFISNLFPNPGKDKFELTFNRMIESGKVEMFNTIGELVFTLNVEQSTGIEFNMHTFANGMYFLRVFDGKIYSGKKLILQKN